MLTTSKKASLMQSPGANSLLHLYVLSFWIIAAYKRCILFSTMIEISVFLGI